MIGSTLHTRRLTLRPLDPEDAPLLLSYVRRNRRWLEPWEPTHPESYYTLEGQRSILYQCLDDRRAESGVLFGVFERTPPDEAEDEAAVLQGRVSVSGIVRGIWRNGFVGYSISGDKNGQGYMTEALQRVVRYAFTELRLHRLQASIIPRNAASLRVAEKCRFRYEGRALRYLKIDGTWEDHEIFALTAEELESGYP